MVPQQSEDQPSLLGNAREPPHLEGVIHMTGHMMATSIKDVAVQAPDGSVGQIDSLRHDQLASQGIAPGLENMQIPVPANENTNHIATIRQDYGRDESEREYGPPGQRKAGVDERANEKDVQQKDGDLAADEDEDAAYKDKGNNSQHPDDVSTCYKFDSTRQIVMSETSGSFQFLFHRPPFRELNSCLGPVPLKRTFRDK